jgi:CheY-like chemotaxis protein
MPARPEPICYVEDDEDIQRIVRMSLERSRQDDGRVVGDPMVAIERMTAFKPDLVMLDWMMPGMDGPALFRKMREVPETQGPAGGVHHGQGLAARDSTS